MQFYKGQSVRITKPNSLYAYTGQAVLIKDGTNSYGFPGKEVYRYTCNECKDGMVYNTDMVPIDPTEQFSTNK